MERYDLVVIGSGPAGEKGAAQAAYFGRRGALVERTPHVGGAGVNTGTVPSTTLRETALYFSGLRQRGLYGVAYGVKTDLTVQDFMDREQEVVKALREVVRANVERHAIDLVHGEAALEDAHTVHVRRRPTAPGWSGSRPGAERTRAAWSPGAPRGPGDRDRRQARERRDGVARRRAAGPPARDVAAAARPGRRATSSWTRSRSGARRGSPRTPSTGPASARPRAAAGSGRTRCART